MSLAICIFVITLIWCLYIAYLFLTKQLTKEILLGMYKNKFDLYKDIGFILFMLILSGGWILALW